MIIPSGALFDRFGSFRIAAGVEAQPVFGIVDKSGAVSDLTGRSIVWRFLDVHNVVVGTPIAATVNGATATFAFTGALTESLRTGGVAGFEIAMLTATGRVVLHRGAASIDDAAPFLGGVAGAPGTDSLTILAAAGTLIISAQGAPGSSTEALAAAALANGAAAAAQDRTTFADAAGRAANAAAVDSVAKTALAVAATGKADVATGAAKAATDDSVAKTALAVIATGAANAGATAANTAAAQIVPEGGPSLLIKPGTGTFPAIADAYFVGKKSLYSSFDGLRRQLRGLIDVTDFSRATTATYFDAAGVLQTAASGVARLGYRFNTGSSTWVLAGLLVEGQDTEYTTNSSGSGAVVGVTGAGGALPTGWSAPGGIPNREVVGFGTVNGIPYVDLRFSGVPTTTGPQSLTFSNAAVTTAGSIWTIGLYTALQAGSLANVSVFTLRCEAELGITFTPDSALTNRVRTTTLTGTNSRTVLRWNYIDTATLVDFTLRLALPQCRLASFLSSPVLTNGVQVTRAGDVFSKALGIEFNPAAQTALFSVRFERSPADTISKVVWVWDDGTLLNRVAFLVLGDGRTSLQSRVATGDTTVSGPALVAGTDYKISIGFGGGSLRLCVNGTVYQVAITASPTGLSTRRIGGSTTPQLNAFIQPYLPHPTNPLLDATEFPRLLSVAEMQAYTA